MWARIVSIFYALEITKEHGEPAGTEVELFLGGTSMFFPYYKYTTPNATSPSSIWEPADAQSVLAVGAINYSNWETGPQEDFSSQGPTNAWAGSAARIKPDIGGPDGVCGHTYGTTSFFGTSAATPHVAGAAALILSMNPHLTADGLQSFLESNAVDMGLPGKDNLYGWGRLNLNIGNVNIVRDLDDSRSIDLVDAIIALQLLSALNTVNIRSDYVSSGVDVNGDDTIGPAEIIYILQKISKVR